MFDTETKRKIKEYSLDLDVAASALFAIVEVESAGKTGVVVNGKFKPVIRIEGHYFYDRLSGEKRKRAVREGLAHPYAGRVKNPRSQTARYEMLDRMKAIDEDAALESCSWGVGQVMGANWEHLGYPSVQALVEEAMSGVAGQVRVMIEFIKANHLVDELRNRNWAGFARAYNGPAYAKHGYHTKMARAYQRWSGRSTDFQKDDNLTRMGDKGQQVVKIQNLLNRNGYFLKVDGDYGPITKKAVQKFQKDNDLAVDGIVGPKTLTALSSIDQVAKHKQPGKKEEQAAKVSGLIGVSSAAAAELSAEALKTSDKLKEYANVSEYFMIAGGALVIVSLGLIAYSRLKKSNEEPEPA